MTEIGKYKDIHANSIAVRSDGEPECVITWVRRPAGGIRMYATRDVRDTDWGQRTAEATSEVVWHLGANLSHVLIVDRETPAEALQWVLERWGREDAEARAEAEEQARIERFRQHAIAGMNISDPKALTPGLPEI
jgi:hypothetical protein